MKILAWVNLVGAMLWLCMSIFTGVNERNGAAVLGAVISTAISLPLFGRILGWW